MRQPAQQVDIPQDLADDAQKVREEPDPPNSTEGLRIAYMLVLWEHLPPTAPTNSTKKRTTGIGYGITNTGGMTGTK
jgi:hypothetical protein